MTAVRWTPEQLESFLKRQTPAPKTDAALQRELARMGVPMPCPAPVPVDGQGEDAVAPVKKKRRGVNVRPIVTALRQSELKVAAGEGFFSVRMEGARVLTVNEMFSILQYRKQEMFEYKNVCHRRIEEAVTLAKLQGGIPSLKGPVRLWLYRRGTKRVDRVDMTTIFKYLIDACVKQGIVVDDRDEVICDVRMQQENGEPALALRFEHMPEGYPSKGLDFDGGFWTATQTFREIEPPTLKARAPAKSKSAKPNPAKSKPVDPVPTSVLAVVGGVATKSVATKSVATKGVAKKASPAQVASKKKAAPKKSSPARKTTRAAS